MDLEELKTSLDSPSKFFDKINSMLMSKAADAISDVKAELAGKKEEESNED
jgi:hypothetical protein